MRRASAQLQSDRRAEILAAAQRCFVRAGFHGASMQDICAQAGMSPGDPYRSLPSPAAVSRRTAARRAGAGSPAPAIGDIGPQAGMSPGNLYRYFPSKEALIAGSAERDRAE